MKRKRVWAGCGIWRVREKGEWSISFISLSIRASRFIVGALSRVLLRAVCVELVPL